MEESKRYRNIFTGMMVTLIEFGWDDKNKQKTAEYMKDFITPPQKTYRGAMTNKGKQFYTIPLHIFKRRFKQMMAI